MVRGLVEEKRFVRMLEWHEKHNSLLKEFIPAEPTWPVWRQQLDTAIWNYTGDYMSHFVVLCGDAYLEEDVSKRSR
jgi:hypothetical protein